MSKKILIIAAHPDDEVLGCGGTIARYREKNIPVRVVFLAEGVTSRYDNIELQSDHVINESKRRNSNAFIALNKLSVHPDQIFVNNRYCCRLDQVAQLDLVKEVERHISEWEPSCIYTHSPYDVNIDHRVVYQVVLAAIRPNKSSSLVEMYSFEVLSSTEWNTAKPFHANVFVDVCDFIDLKIEAMKLYKGEMYSMPHSRSEESIRSLSRYRGVQAGLEYAEAFNLIRMIDK
jgi:LmbE family N-acetylglucosaminyl deacetylase